MPLFQIGYRRFEGQRTSPTLRWLPITRTGLTIAWRSKLLRRLVFISFAPFLYFGWLFFLIGRVTDSGTDPSLGGISNILQGTIGGGFLDGLQNNPSEVRSAVWSFVFALSGSNVQLVVVGLVAAIVGPPLISNDIRSRAFLIYFSRPISRVDYVLGKAGTLVVVLAAVTLLPSLLLYTMSILFSPSVDTLVQTLPVLLSIVLASLGAIIPVTLIVLALSSVTKQPRFATAAWVVLGFFGPLAHTILQETQDLRDTGWTFLLSLPHSVRALQLGLYDVAGRMDSPGFSSEMDGAIAGLTTSDSAGRAAVWLTFVSIACFFVLLRRVDAPTRI